MSNHEAVFTMVEFQKVNFSIQIKYSRIIDNGTNLLAIQVHNATANSSDMSK